MPDDDINPAQESPAPDGPAAEPSAEADGSLRPAPRRRPPAKGTARPARTPRARRAPAEAPPAGPTLSERLKALEEAAAAEAKAQQEADAKLRRLAAQRARREEKARREAEERARQEAEERDRLAAERAATRSVEERARRERARREERARRQAEQQARLEAEEAARLEAEEAARREAEEAAAREAEEAARRLEEERAAEEAARVAKREAQEAERAQKRAARARKRPAVSTAVETGGVVDEMLEPAEESAPEPSTRRRGSKVDTVIVSAASADDVVTPAALVEDAPEPDWSTQAVAEPDADRPSGWGRVLVALSVLLLAGALGMGAAALVMSGEKTWSSTTAVRFLPPGPHAAASAERYADDVAGLTSEAAGIAGVPERDRRGDLSATPLGSDQLRIRAGAAYPDEAERLAAAGAERLVNRVVTDSNPQALPDNQLSAVVSQSAQPAERTEPDTGVALAAGCGVAGVVLLLGLVASLRRERRSVA